MLLSLGQCGILSMINTPVLFTMYSNMSAFQTNYYILSIIKDWKYKYYQGPKRQGSDRSRSVPVYRDTVDL